MIKQLLVTILLSVVTITAFADDYISAPTEFTGTSNHVQWRQIETQLETTSAKVIIIRWGGYGGYISWMQEFIQSIETAQRQGKIIIFDLNGNSYSAHAIAACYADELLNLDDYYLMFHNAAIGDTPNADPTYANEYKVILQKCVDKGILTSSDVLKILSLSEVYVKKVNGKIVREYRLDRRF